MADQYWRGAAEDEVMQDEHGFIWLAMLEMVDAPLAGKKVLDARNLSDEAIAKLKGIP